MNGKEDTIEIAIALAKVVPEVLHTDNSALPEPVDVDIGEAMKLAGEHFVGRESGKGLVGGTSALHAKDAH